VQIQEGGTGSDQRGQIQSLSPGIDGKVSQWDKLLLALFRETVRELVQDDQGSGNPAATGEDIGTVSLARVNGSPSHMGLFTEDIKTLDGVFVHTVRDISMPNNRSRRAFPI
jgi:hypothetical protein